jgi:hypothetical protein
MYREVLATPEHSTPEALMAHLLRALAFLLSLVDSTVLAESWCGPASNEIAPNGKYPTSWRLWEVDLPGRGASAPDFENGDILLRTFNTLYCISG